LCNIDPAILEYFTATKLDLLFAIFENSAIASEFLIYGGEVAKKRVGYREGHPANKLIQ
jgi:hypothetical protein